MRYLIFLGLSGCTILTGALDKACGDGFVQKGELCDDGNTTSGDGCRSDCLKIEVCGDGVLDDGELCDDNNTTSGDGCRSDCSSTEICGNSTIDVGEFCDDGNATGGDGCSADCSKIEVCGDGFSDEGEVCDDNNTTPGDGCRADCLGAEVCNDTLVDAGKVCFSNGVSLASEDFPVKIASGDLDEDGHVDIAIITKSVANQPDGKLQLFLGNGNGDFSAPITFTVGAGLDGKGVVIADLDDDGDLDIATIFNQPTDPFLAELVVFIQDTPRQFTQKTHFSGFGEVATALAVLDDTTGDGLPELAVSLSGTNAIQILQSAPINAEFFAAGVVLSNNIAGPTDVLTADIIEDVGQDLAVLNATDSTIQIFPRLANGLIDGAPQATVTLTTSTPFSFVAANLDSDPKLDFGVTFANSIVRSFNQTTPGSFFLGLDVPSSNVSAIAAIDLDADTDIDFIVTNHNTGGQVSLFINNGAGGFSDGGSKAAGDQPTALATGDFNEDSVTDFVAASFGTPELIVFLSNP